MNRRDMMDILQRELERVRKRLRNVSEEQRVKLVREAIRLEQDIEALRALDRAP